MRSFVALLLGSITSIMTVSAASAGPLAASTILDDFNAIIYSNAFTSADVEGAAVIGGNLTAATIFNHPTGTQPLGFGALTVYGNTSGNSININDGGSAYVGGSKGASINFNGGGGYIDTPGTTIAGFSTPLDALSLSLSQLTPTGSLPTTGNNEVITAVPGANGIAVIDLTAVQLAAIPSFSINLNGASTLVFNVLGALATFNANESNAIATADNVIWNFFDATSVNLSTRIGGTVLATDALVTNDNQIDGTLVANSWTGQGELHDYGFDGTLPTASVPEPAAMTILGVGLFGLGTLRRRRRSI
jgi:choice-of-anchor A domain-containing protein